MSAAAHEFQERGFAVLPGLLSEEEVEQALRVLEQRSGIRREAFPRARVGRGLYRGWTVPDGVCRTRELWPLVFKPELLDAVRARLGEEARFLQHDDLHVGFSARTWHRDNVTRRFAVGGDWNEAEEPYRLLRVGLYLQERSQSGFSLGLVPGSHRRLGRLADDELRRLDRAAGLARQALGVLTGRDPLAARATWVEAAAGDAVLFDPRVLHAGSAISGPKYSLFFAYGVPGRHYSRHFAYYRHLRSDLRYASLPAELERRLRLAGLYAECEEPDGVPAGAFRPSGLRTLLGRAIRPR